MKIALLSFHTAANYGASLQAYAFERFLSLKGFNCEYINYVNASRAHEYSMSWHIFDSLRHGNIKSAIAYMLGSPFMTLRKRRFNKFYKKNLRKTKKVYHTSEEAATLNDYYDYFVVGSDQVWNPICNGDDTAFLLDFVKDGKKRISYSSSFGMSEIDEKHREVYKKNFEQFKSLAVRETIGQKLIKDLTGRDSKLVLDPVLLLTKEQWMELMPKKEANEKFIFSYTNRDSQTTEFFKTGYRLEGRKHYVLSRYTRPQDFLNPQVRVKYCMSPEEFLFVINNADLIVSASFHCIALSIILNRQFVAFLTGDEGKDERIIGLLRTLNLENRIFYKGMKIEEIISPINYVKVNKLIEEIKIESVNYLNKVLQ